MFIAALSLLVGFAGFDLSQGAHTLARADIAQATTFGGFVLSACFLHDGGHVHAAQLVTLLGIVLVAVAHLRYRRVYRAAVRTLS